MFAKKNKLGGYVFAAISFLSLCLSASANAQWRLNQDASYLYYISSKVSAVSEVNTFSDLSGGIDNAGKATLVIELASVDTAVDVRNQRVKDILFEIAQFPQATASLNVDIASLDKLPAGSFSSSSYQVNVNLHGMSQTVSAELQVTKLDLDRIQVQLAKPLIINAASFGMAEGVEELREIAKLPSINNNVVVGFTLLFEK